MSRTKKRSNAIRNAVVFSLIIGYVLGFATSAWLNRGNDTSKPAVPVQATEAPAQESEPEVAEDTTEATDTTEEMSWGDLPEEQPSETNTEAAEGTEALSVEPEPTDAPTPAPTQVPDQTVKQYKVSGGYSAPIVVHIPSDVDAVFGAKDSATETPSEPAGIVEVVATDTPAPTEEPKEVDLGNMTIEVSVSRYMDPDYYVAHYGNTYQLAGNEACVEIEFKLASSDNGIISLRPQDVFDSISIVLSDGSIVPGYSMINREIGSGSDIVSNPNITVDSPALLYKRFDYPSSGAKPEYLRVVASADGVTSTYDFTLGDAATSYVALVKGDQGDAVQALQEKLIALGYMEGPADGDFGSKTEEAIKKAQTAIGQEPTGIADAAFQKILSRSGNTTSAADGQGTATEAGSIG